MIDEHSRRCHPLSRGSNLMQRRPHGNSTCFPTKCSLVSSFPLEIANTVSTRQYHLHNLLVCTCPVIKPSLQIYKAQEAFNTISSKPQSCQTTQTTHILSLPLQYHNEPDFGYSPHRRRVEQTQPGPVPFPFINASRSGAELDTIAFDRTDWRQTKQTVTKENNERGRHRRHRCGRHLHRRHAHNPAVQNRGMEPLRWAGEETRRLSSIIRQLTMKLMGVELDRRQHTMPKGKTKCGLVGQYLARTKTRAHARGTRSPGLDQNGVAKMSMLWELGRCLS